MCNAITLVKCLCLLYDYVMSVDVLICYSIQSYLFLIYVLLLKTDLLIPVFHKSFPCTDIESLGFSSIFIVVPSSVLDLDTLYPSDGNKGPGGSVRVEQIMYICYLHDNHFCS